MLNSFIVVTEGVPGFLCGTAVPGTSLVPQGFSW